MLQVNIKIKAYEIRRAIKANYMPNIFTAGHFWRKNLTVSNINNVSIGPVYCLIYGILYCFSPYKLSSLCLI